MRIISLYISNYELQGDEAQYWYWSQSLQWGYYSKPPFIAWIISVSTSIIGNSVFAIKLPSLIFHFFTSILIFYLCRSFNRIKEECLWSSITYLLFFGVILSSNIISTDPFLIFFWTGSLLFFKQSLEKESIKYLIATSLFVALGFYTKYAMIYFLLCSFFLLFFFENKKKILFKIFIIILIVIILILPHLYWIYKSQWVTVLHTSDNFNWGSNLFNIDKLISFFISQFFIASPIIFYIYLSSFLKLKSFLKLYYFEISYSLPIIGLLMIQSFISRANANWTSVAFVSICLISTNIIFNRSKKTLYLNTIVGISVTIFISLILIFSPKIYPFTKLIGAEDASKEIKFLDDSLNVDYIVFDDRMLVSKFIYYLKTDKKKIKYLAFNNFPENHFALSIPITVKQLENKTILMIHKYKEVAKSTNKTIIVQQLYEMPDKKNNFYISYLE